MIRLLEKFKKLLDCLRLFMMLKLFNLKKMYMN